MAERKSFLLRMDPEVYDALQRWAADELRSLNAQIEFLLRASLKASGRLRGGARPVAVQKDAGAGKEGGA